MFYTIYKVTNILDDKIYIGKHQTKDLDDGYMGSGKHLKRAISKYGIENFKKEILFVFDDENKMNDKEAELVNNEFVLREDTYNICVGGQGGFSYLNDVYWTDVKLEKRRKDVAEKLKGNANCAIGGKKTGCKNMTDAHKKGKIRYDTFSGKNHSEETRKKMSLAKKGKGTGDKNSQFGTIWITNGEENKKIKKDIDIIPEGWYRGRKK